MQEEDKYIYLEDLNDITTKKFIDDTNIETRKKLGDKASKIFPDILDSLNHENPISLVALKDYPVILFYGEKSKVVEGNSKTEVYSSKDYVISSLQKVYNSKDNKFAITAGKKGSDRTNLIILPDEIRVDERASNPFYLDGQLCYVKTYVETPPSDGGETPTERIICNGEIVYGKDLKPGNFIYVQIFNGEVFLTKSIGWRWEELYHGETLDKLKKIDEGEVIIPIKEGPIYLKNDKLITSDRQIKIQHPVINAVAGDDFITVQVIKNYRTSLLFYNKDLTMKGEQFHDNITSIDSSGKDIYFIETSFKFRYKIFKNNDIIIKSGDEDSGINVKDIYVTSDVLLHGFLLSKSIPSKGTLVYGYGGFRIPLLPNYSVIFNYLLNKGYSILITNLRGGYENGEEWHKDGMLLNKKNVFKDFEEFIKIVKSFGGKVIAMGGSNGGLLVGVTINEIPEHVDCAIISHPVLDMMRYHKMYVGKYWVEEYGNPEDPKYRDYLLSYSPYHNLRNGLPKTLVLTGLNDDRVHPAHAFKYVARSKELGNNVLLFTSEKGHAISDPESMAEEMSYEIAFIEECLGLSNVS